MNDVCEDFECKYCQGRYDIIDDSGIVAYIMEDLDATYLVVEVGIELAKESKVFRTQYKIDNCPMCGREFENGE